MSVLKLTGALYLLDPCIGRQSVLCRQCSAKTQQHTAREVRILAPSGTELVHRQAGFGPGGAVSKAGSHTAAESGATSL
ncbi:hypothetical protein CesoFtcFv8_003273 [Champsocephalus esox]|uniref:Uncharacterized protein n=2 Tax=Champsocephalus TaxID=52236 RepID=A0AAN8HXG0_CHAGU|nr:hypothetical protein CesoFtcFv8_003273 [Champsocephalus esox]KAK5931956.1 hypothetical protein CgunFtcFv8_003701 [Champsocephalus gunnari]